jgi:3-oxoacyl-[acyl-carrier-protein] synthase-3
MPVVPNNFSSAQITGWGISLPETILTNEEISTFLDTSDEWIYGRTGVHQRHIGGTTVSLSVESAKKAILRSNIDPSEIDCLILVTATPDRQWGTASIIQDQLGLSCGAFEINSACSGFVYALVNAYGMISMGSKSVLIISTDTFSRIVDWNDRSVAPLFADGSASVVLQKTSNTNQLLSWHLDSDGSAADILHSDVGGNVQMNGKEVFRKAVRVMVESARITMDLAGVSSDEISLVIPHQANIRIIQSACDKLGIDISKTHNTLEYTGNTSSASIPIALSQALDLNLLSNGDYLLLVGFGGGMTAASALLKWGI